MSAIGQLPHRASIQSVSLGFPCVITTTEAHGYQTFDFVRLTSLNGRMPAPKHGVDQLDGNRYRIVVLGNNTFKLQDPITFEDIDSQNFPTYTSGGNTSLVERTFYFYGPTKE